MRPFINTCAFSLLVMINATAYAQGNSTVWKVDPSGSKVVFITQGKGGIEAYFNKFRGTAQLDPKNLKTFNIQLEIDANSLSAGLKTPFYKGKKGLDVSQYPKLYFNSTRVDQVSAQQYRLHGTLDMHGVNKPVIWNMRIDSHKTNHKQIMMQAVTHIDRREWGLQDFKSMIDPTIKLEVRTKLVPN